MVLLKFLHYYIINIHNTDSELFSYQTLLYLFEPIELNKDQIIEGSVTISQSQQHARFLNICLKYLWAFFVLVYFSFLICLVIFELE
jgi:hypothetical protein